MALSTASSYSASVLVFVKKKIKENKLQVKEMLQNS